MARVSDRNDFVLPFDDKLENALARTTMSGGDPRRLMVSVAVPARNEEASLPELLRSLLAQTWPPDEIVVADGGSTDGTATVAEKFASQGARLLSIGPAFPGRGRNAAIAAARQEWVALIDAGCTADTRWLEELIAPVLRDPTVDVVFGDYRPLLQTEWDRAQALTFVPPPDALTQMRPAATVSMLIRRSCWEQAGRFREDLRAAEDLLFFRALEAVPVRLARAPRAVVVWRLAPGPLAAFRRLRLYSTHHLRAGLFRTWHLRVMAMDAAALALVVASFFAPGAVIPLLLAGSVRVLRTANRRKHNLPEPHPLRATRLARVAFLLMLADAAVWLGAFSWLRESRAPA